MICGLLTEMILANSHPKTIAGPIFNNELHTKMLVMCHTNMFNNERIDTEYEVLNKMHSHETCL